MVLGGLSSGRAWPSSREGVGPGVAGSVRGCHSSGGVEEEVHGVYGPLSRASKDVLLRVLAVRWLVNSS
jgi:hypothetical protein